ncbi:MAG: type II toxin-antitoxin system RelE/ParE family toxin [bacterium]|nr:type II toxin-antitoxin system RelE/ParE family toxin [bacterium]
MYSNTTWSVEVRSKVRKALGKIPAQNAGAVIAVIQELQTDPFSGDIEKLKGKNNAWRRRIGPFRIFYEIYQQTHSVFVYRVERRGSHTYKH